MIAGLDHVVALVRDIGAAKAAYQTLLGRAPSWQNFGDGADRVLFTLQNMSIELMAPSGASATADRMRELLDDREGMLASLCFRVADINKMHRRLDRVALKPDAVAEVESRDDTTGAVLHWKRTRAATELTRGVRMFFLELGAERPLSAVTDAGPVLALDHVVVATEDSERAAALYGARLGLDMALDRSHHDWGQLMFFRCGDLVVEVVRRPVAGGDASHDRLWGFSWRVGDIDATRTRLTAAGVDVSDVRNGRKPGTRVMTVRNGTCGIQTILLEQSPRPAA
ncbi:VOC family protein [Bradyrhizobium manausense]|uniref:VOC family protein n=1 Tax=Bradyrhizobium TaxID=374 RepID=UPI001BA5B58D|nr:MULTISPECIES: VOC family protein [Bradyrhizobium]MBR0824389.1 VOC family protein [Bradyrhizobium manausense]UVO26782.1 VOC family protein [Bradyrhizobium arachidis]